MVRHASVPKAPFADEVVASGAIDEMIVLEAAFTATGTVTGFACLFSDLLSCSTLSNNEEIRSDCSC
jgi:hypothetical protein